MTPNSCTECGKKLGKEKRRKTMLCRPCSSRRTAQDPERRRKCSEAMARKAQEPGYREQHSEIMKKVFAEVKVRNPDFIDQKRAHARRVGLAEAGRRSAKQAPGSAGRMSAGFKTRERHMGWCPPEYRADYRHLVYSKKFKKAEAKGIILRQIEKDAAAYQRTGQLQRTKAVLGEVG